MKELVTQVVTIANQKGGVGKTTTAQNIGAALSLMGKNVLLVDVDEQCDLTKLFLNNYTKNIGDLFVSENPKNEINSCIYNTDNEKIKIIIDSISLGNISCLIIPQDTVTPKNPDLNVIKTNTAELDTTKLNTIKISDFTFNCVEKKSESKFKTSANQFLFSCTTLLSLIFTLFIYIIRRNVEREIEKIDDKDGYKYEFIADLLDSICSNKNLKDIEKKRRKEELGKIFSTIQSELKNLSDE